MIETARSIFRELVALWEEKKAATYSALVTFLAVYFINVSRQQGKALENRQEKENTELHLLIKENKALNTEVSAWKDSAFSVTAQYARHLEGDIKRFDTTSDHE